MTTIADARQRAAALPLHGVLAHWAECAESPGLDPLLTWEEILSIKGESYRRKEAQERAIAKSRKRTAKEPS
jgi:hypothetical protein